MKRSVRFLTPFLGIFAGSLAHAAELPNFTAYEGAAPSHMAAPTRAAQLAQANQRAASVGGYVSSVDERRGVPTFLWAVGPQPALPAGSTPESAARQHLNRFAEVYGLPPAALRTAQVVHVHDGGQGAVIVALRQRIDGADVFWNEIKVLMRQNLELVAISGNLHDQAVPTGKAASRRFGLSDAQAIANALTDLYGTAVSAQDVVSTQRIGEYRYFDLAQSAALKGAHVSLARPARVKKVFFPMPDRLVPGYFLELLAGDARSTSSDGYSYVIAADDGRVLFRQNLTESDTYNYRVWAETTGNGRPLDGPQADYTPSPSGAPDGIVPPFIAPSLVAMQGFNTNPSGAADPWLPTNARQTLGNNVDAYADHFEPDGFTNDDFRATTTSDRTFDRVYDTALAPTASRDQTMAAITQLFYVTNWLHDWYYDSGFNEAAGNAQRSNYGRGGLGNDVMHAEAQDTAFFPTVRRNNANMTTFADGESPRMQMFVWDGKAGSILIDSLGMRLTGGTAGFGPLTFDLTGDLVIANDGTAPTSDGCTPLVNTAEIAGKIAVIDRGTCTFKTKALSAQDAGAIGVILVNHRVGSAPTMADGDPPLPVTIPMLSVTQSEGATIKQALLEGPVTAALARIRATDRDGTIDSTIIAHEWGHYFHHRLVNASNKQSSAMSEGWGDFTALHMVLREDDNFENGTFALTIYAGDATANNGYFGIRRAPYTLDLSKNGFTFQHITDNVPLPSHPIGSGGATNSEVHNAGEIWASMLFDAYSALLLRQDGGVPVYTFDEARRLISDYLVAGMKLTGTDPTYTEQRDAILAAVYARSPEDMLAMAAGFARRGAGSCAESPDRFSRDFAGVVESFELKSRAAVTSVRIDDSTWSCDDDGYLDAGERGKVTIAVANQGIVPLNAPQVTLTSSSGAVTFPNGATVTLPSMPPFSTTTVEVDVSVADGLTDVETLDLGVAVASSDSCDPTYAVAKGAYINVREASGASSVDDVESSTSAWVKRGAFADEIWTRDRTGVLNSAWRGADFRTLSDTQLESPDLHVSASEPFVISFDHRYSFETDVSRNPPTYFDGAVIELSQDGGVTWQDVSTLADPHYGGALSAGDADSPSSNNPLAGRRAFVNRNAAWPAAEAYSLDLGAALADRTVRVRFRIGTDSGSGDFGWEIDNIRFQGITNLPFGVLSPDDTTCPAPPIADAGEDQTVTEGDAVALDASGSSDVNNDPLTFAWTQTAGPTVALTDADTASPTFTAPEVMADATLTFEVEVSDGTESSTDTVDVLVVDVPGQGVGGSGGGTGGSGGSGGEATGTGGSGGAGGSGGTGGSGGSGGTGGSGGSGGTGGSGGSGGTGGSGGDGEGGDAPSSGTPSGSTGDDGCGCVAAGATPTTPAMPIASLLALAVLAGRRRRAGRGA